MLRHRTGEERWHVVAERGRRAIVAATLAPVALARRLLLALRGRAVALLAIMGLALARRLATLRTVAVATTLVARPRLTLGTRLGGRLGSCRRNVFNGRHDSQG